MSLCLRKLWERPPHTTIFCALSAVDLYSFISAANRFVGEHHSFLQLFRLLHFSKHRQHQSTLFSSWCSKYNWQANINTLFLRPRSYRIWKFKKIPISLYAWCLLIWRFSMPGIQHLLCTIQSHGTAVPK